MKKIFCILLLISIVFTLSACVDDSVKGSVVRETTHGNAELDIMPQKLLEQIDIGDTVIVDIGDFRKEMPLVEKLIEEDGKLQLFLNKENWSLSICIYNENFCETNNVNAGAKVKIRKNNTT